MVSRSELKGRIQTVRGLIEPGELGATLMHEHLLCDITPPKLAALNQPWPEITLEKGMAIFALPVPERAADGLLFRTSDGVVRVERAHIPGRPIEDAERTSGEQEEAAALFDRVKSVWARLPSVPMMMRHLPPGSLDPEVLEDRLSHAHARHRNLCRGGCRLERRP